MKILGEALSRRRPSRWHSSSCLKRQLKPTDNWHRCLDVEKSMMKSAQLAHGEYEKYIDTNLKHKRTCTGHRHCLFSRGSGFHFSSMEHKLFCYFSLRVRAEVRNECVLSMLYCVSTNFSLSLSLSIYLSLSLSLSHLAWRSCWVAGLELCVNQTLVK